VSETTYTVNVWTQKLTADEKQAMTTDDPEKLKDCYAFQGSFIFDAASGATITVDSNHSNLKNLSTLSTYNSVFGKSLTEAEKEENPFFGFAYSESHSDIGIEVKPDGTSVINVRYDRNVHTLTFNEASYAQVNSYFNGCYGYVSNVGYVQVYYSYGRYYFDYNGNTYNYSTYGNGRYYRRTDNTVKTIIAPYGANIVSDFPNTSMSGYAGTQWDPEPKNTFKFVLATVETMPDEDVAFTNTGRSTEKTIIYYLETSREDSDGTTFDGKWYKESKRANHGFNYITYDEEYHPITGYVRNTDQADPVFRNDGDAKGLYAPIGSGNVNRLYYDRQTYQITFYNPASSSTRPIRTDSFKFKEAIGNLDETYQPERSGYRFSGWYMDAACKTKVFFSQEDYDNAVLPDGQSKELLANMPSRNIQLFAKWVTEKYQANIIPNGGEMSEQDRTSFNLDPDEKIAFAADPTREYVKVAAGTGTHSYDAVNGRYELTELNDGDYVQRSGAYTFQGWYEAKMTESGQTLEEYEKDGEKRYRYVQNGQPLTNEDGEYQVGKRFNLNVAPNKAVTIVAVWQRAGGFRVEYDAGEGVMAPEDDNEYMDGSHAVVRTPVSAPKDKTLDYWQDKHGRKYRPNELVSINENNADQVGTEMVVKLTAVYRDYIPVERDMADYTFMKPSTQNEDGSWNYEVHEVQRIAINEELKAPLTPEMEGYVFKGWYYDSEGIQRFTGFGTITNPVYTTLYAVYEKAFTVNYYLTDSNTMEPTSTVIATQTYLDDGKTRYMDTRGVKHPVDVDHYVDYWVSDWSKRGDDTANAGYQFPYNTASRKVVNGATPGMDSSKVMNMYAVLKARTYVQFDSRGGSFVDTQEIPSGGWPVRPADPTRAGFKFDGWYTQATGGARYDFDKTFDDVKRDDDATFDPNNAILYARWSEDPNGAVAAKINVVFSAQNAELGDSYELQETVTLDTFVGRVITLDNLDGLLSANGSAGYNSMSHLVNVDDDDRPFFAVNGDKCDQRVVVDEDGSVFNVRFDRKKYRFEFMPKSGKTIYYQGRTYNRTNKYSFEVWLGKNIESEWPTSNSVRNVTGYPKAYYNDTGNVYWQSSSDPEYNTLTMLQTVDHLMLPTADGKTTVTWIDNGNTSYSKKFIVRYFLDGNQYLPYRQELVRSASASSYVADNVTYTGYTNAFAMRNVIGYDVVTKRFPSDEGEYNVRVGNTSTGRVLGKLQDSSSTETISYTVYEYQEIEGHEQFYYLSDNEYLPVSITIDNSSGDKNSFKVTYEKNGSRQEVPYGSSVYRLASSSTTDAVYKKASWDAFVHDTLNVTTSTKQSTVSISGSPQYVSFYFTRASYKIDFYLNATDTYGDRSITVPYEKFVPDAISEAGIPDPDEYAPNGKEFDCWSESPTARIEYDRNMPAHDVTLYPWWKNIEYTVTTVGVDQAGNANAYDEQGNPRTFANGTYTAAHGQKLKELHIPNPKAKGKLFAGWKIYSTDTTITGNYTIRGNLKIEPVWTSLDERTVQYFPNGGSGITADADGSLPLDDNKYMLGAKVVIKDGSALSIPRTSIDGQAYTGTFAYWNTKPDGSGMSYYPNTTFTFRAGDPTTLKLYAIYSQYRETILTYDKNADDARFVLRDNEEQDYQGVDLVAEDGTVQVLFRDQLNPSFPDSFQKKPNDVFYVGEDEDNVKFTVVRTETLKDSNGNDRYGGEGGNELLTNTYLFGGWATTPDANLPLAQNGDRAYVNTINEKTENTLYALWAVCKIQTKEMNKYNTEVHYERVFPSIQSAVDYVNSDPVDAKGNKIFDDKTATIEMLIDYHSLEHVSVPSGCDITLTTAAKSGKGVKYKYTGSGDVATVTRWILSGSMFTSKGSLTLTDITLDGNRAFCNANTMGTLNGNLMTATTSGAELGIGQGATLRNAWASNGGAVYVAGSAELNMTGGTITNCMATDGGAVYVGNGGTMGATGGTIADCVATPSSSGLAGTSGRGGAVYHDSANTMTISGLTINGHSELAADTANAVVGGGIYLNDGSLNMTGGNIRNCTVPTGDETNLGNVYVGGAIYCKSTATNSEGSTVALAGATIDGHHGGFNASTPNARDGGAIYMADGSLALGSGATVQNCKAFNKGGGVYNKTQAMSLSNATVTGCGTTNADNRQGHGGGVYTMANVTLKNGSQVTGNQTASSTTENAAGLHIADGATLTLGGEGIESETSSVKGNKASGNKDSNVRLSESGGKNATNSVSVVSNLGAGCEIRVVNPRYVYDQFGSTDAAHANMACLLVSDTNSAKNILSEDGLLYGRIDTADNQGGTKVVWWGDPVCKITDASGNLLSLKDAGSPAVYLSLHTAYSEFNTKSFKLGDADATAAQIQMLVQSYTLNPRLEVNKSKAVTLTTAPRGTTHYDYQGAEGTQCTIVRGYGDASKGQALFKIFSKANFTFKNITLDGNKSNYFATGTGGLFEALGNSNVTLGEGAELKNSLVKQGKSPDFARGGAFCVKEGATVTVQGVSGNPVKIHDCESNDRGGGAISVYKTATLTINENVEIYNCSSTSNGGAIDVDKGTANVNGGTFSRNHATGQGIGAGIYVAPGQVLNLSGNPTFGSGTDANTATVADYEGKLNGGEPSYAGNSARQDVYLADTADTAQSIRLAGAMTGAAGGIWVWADSDKHYKQSTQFAVIAANESGEPVIPVADQEEQLKVFRDARADDETENGTDTYLFGVQGDSPTMVNWSGLSGTARVVLRKVGMGSTSSYNPLANVGFRLYKRDRATLATDAGGAQLGDAEGVLTSTDPYGVFYAGALRYGTYFLQEENVPDGYARSDDGHAYYWVTVDDPARFDTSKDAYAVSGNMAVQGPFTSRDGAYVSPLLPKS